MTECELERALHYMRMLDLGALSKRDRGFVLSIRRQFHNPDWIPSEKQQYRILKLIEYVAPDEAGPDLIEE